MNSELTCVEQFVRLFEDCDSPAQIFRLIDENSDQFVDIDEIRRKVT